MKAEITAETVKAAPPVGLTVAMATTEITLNEWVAIATLAYIALQAGYLIYKWYREYRASK